MGSQQEKEELPNETFKEPSRTTPPSSQSQPALSQTETVADVQELSQKMEELSSQEKPENDDVFTRDSQSRKLAKKRPIDDNKEKPRTDDANDETVQEIKEETDKCPEKKAKEDGFSSSEDEESDVVKITFNLCARFLGAIRKYEIPDPDRNEAISYIESKISQFENLLKNKKDTRPIHRPCRVTAIEGPNAHLLDLLDIEDELFQLRMKLARSHQDLQACLAIFRATLTQLRKFNK